MHLSSSISCRGGGGGGGGPGKKGDFAKDTVKFVNFPLSDGDKQDTKLRHLPFQMGYDTEQLFKSKFYCRNLHCLSYKPMLRLVLSLYLLLPVFFYKNQPQTVQKKKKGEYTMTYHNLVLRHLNSDIFSSCMCTHRNIVLKYLNSVVYPQFMQCTHHNIVLRHLNSFCRWICITIWELIDSTILKHEERNKLTNFSQCSLYALHLRQLEDDYIFTNSLVFARGSPQPPQGMVNDRCNGNIVVIHKKQHDIWGGGTFLGRGVLLRL